MNKNGTTSFCRSVIEGTFRFRKPKDILNYLRLAMFEKDIRRSTSGSTDDANRKEWQFDKFYPRVFGRKWNWGESSQYDGLDRFLEERVLQIASTYCDPDKAYDFENYPELEYWSSDALEDKLKEKYVRFSPFCDKMKYLLSLCHILELCCVKRAPCRVEGRERTGSGRWAENSSLTGTYSNCMKALLKNQSWVSAGYDSGTAPTNMILFTTSNGPRILQRQIQFSTWVDDTRPCDIKFFACAEDTLDEFSSFGAVDYYGNAIVKNKWFCAGVPDTVNNKYTGMSMPFDDEKLPSYTPPGVMRGFSIRKTFSPADFDGRYGCAIRDYRVNGNTPAASTV